ncbi:MAG: insulinase family protein [Candidatus Roizmanbacteria bacterium]|nr:insulinase family protein [Candidatus Roizmanbacteria bacterium]
MKHAINTLANGLRTITVDTGAFPSCTALLLVGTGSRYENEKNNGIAHFFEHMAFKGSKKYPTSMDLAQTVEGFGGVFNAFTSKEYTGYWIKGPVGHVNTMLDVLSDMIQSPTLASEEIEREKGVIVEEINMYEDQPQRRIAELYEQMLFPNSSLGYDITGTKETVRSFTRKTFQDFLHDYYAANNAVLIVAGGIGKNGYEQEINNKFGSWRKAAVSTYPSFKTKQEKNVKVFYKKTEQAHWILGYPSFSIFDDRRYALNVLATILGGGMSSRLFSELREKRGLCYYISSGTDLYLDTGTYYTRAGVPTDPTKVIDALTITIEEQKKVALNISEDELKRAKELMKGHFLLSLEDSFDMAYFMGKRQLFEKEIRTPEEILQKIDAVTKVGVREMAKEILREEKMHIALIGPFKDDVLKSFS